MNMQININKLIANESIIKLWESPTVTTWASLTSRSISVVAILPLILIKFPTEEIALWYLFMTIIGFQLIADMGFSATFTRVFAYAMGGDSGKMDYLQIKTKSEHRNPNWATVTKIYSTMSRVYLWIAATWFIFLVLFGSLAVIRPISHTSNQGVCWIAWGIVIISSTIRIFGAKYTSYITGLNEIALLKRWEIFVWIVLTGVSIVVLLLECGFIWLVLSNQGMVIINVVINRYLALNLKTGFINKNKKTYFDKELFWKIWSRVWRSGIGILMSAGIVQGTGIIYAQIGSTGNIASYLLALTIIRMISQYSQAPFYTKIPLLARLMAEGNIVKQRKIAESGMRLSFWTLIIGIVTVGIFAPTILILIKSNANFVDKWLWSLMGLGTLLERYGAMHVQLYSTTNNIIWHTANGFTGVIFVTLVLLTYKLIGIYSFPVCQIISNLSFYTWYSAKHSYSVFKMDFKDYERKTSFYPLLSMLIYLVLR